MRKLPSKRRERRVDLSRAAVLLNSDSVESDVLILDVSRSGFRLRVEESLRVGELVKLRVERGEEFPVEIRWVLGSEAGGVFLSPIDEAKFGKGQESVEAVGGA